MQRTPIVENVFRHTHGQFHLSYVTIAVTRADFTRTSVTGQSNLIPTKFLISARKEVFT